MTAPSGDFQPVSGEVENAKRTFICLVIMLSSDQEVRFGVLRLFMLLEEASLEEGGQDFRAVTSTNLCS